MNEKTSWRGWIKTITLAAHTTMLAAHATLGSSLLPLGSAQEPQLSTHLPHRWEVEPQLGGTWLPPTASPLQSFSPDRLAADDRRDRLNAAQQGLRAMRFDDRSLGADANVDADASLDAASAALKRLELGEENRSVRLALVSLVIAASDGQHAQRLWKAAESYPDAVPAVLQALVDWKSPVALEHCRQRLTRFAPPWSEVQLAIENIAVGGKPTDRELLEGILHADAATPPIRLAAARALGQVVNEGLEPLSRKLLDSNLPVRELLAATLLSEHNSIATQGLLLNIIQQGPGEAIRAALATLIRLDLPAAQEQAERLSSHPDSGVRLLAIQVMSGLQNETSLNLLVTSLADATPSIRSLARLSLKAMASDSQWQGMIAESLQQMLRSDSPAGIEQAILLSVELNQVESCGQLIELLEHPSPSVSVTAAWGLQELTVPPELLDRLLAYASTWSDRMHGRRADQPVETVDFVRLSYAFERLGRSQYAPAMPVLSEFVAKQSPQMEPTVRASAIWAMGKIDAQSGNPELAKQFLTRLLDNEIGNEENELVKFASALALGNLATLELRDAVLGASESRERKVWQACAWAANEIASRHAASTETPPSEKN